jgi:hypothetical protein
MFDGKRCSFWELNGSEGNHDSNVLGLKSLEGKMTPEGFRLSLLCYQALP